MGNSTQNESPKNRNYQVPQNPPKEDNKDKEKKKGKDKKKKKEERKSPLSLFPRSPSHIPTWSILTVPEQNKLKIAAWFGIDSHGGARAKFQDPQLQAEIKEALYRDFGNNTDGCQCCLGYFCCPGAKSSGVCRCLFCCCLCSCTPAVENLGERFGVRPRLDLFRYDHLGNLIYRGRRDRYVPPPGRELEGRKFLEGKVLKHRGNVGNEGSNAEGRNLDMLLPPEGCKCCCGWYFLNGCWCGECSRKEKDCWNKKEKYNDQGCCDTSICYDRSWCCAKCCKDSEKGCGCCNSNAAAAAVVNSVKNKRDMTIREYIAHDRRKPKPTLDLKDTPGCPCCLFPKEWQNMKRGCACCCGYCWPHLLWNQCQLCMAQRCWRAFMCWY